MFVLRLSISVPVSKNIFRIINKQWGAEGGGPNKQWGRELGKNSKIDKQGRHLCRIQEYRNGITK